MKELANSLAEATGAEVVQVIGRKATLFRDNPDLEWKGNTPPWR
ncbi:MAG: YhbY family RNA-binding protein [Gemmatimonadaceae bacterium]